MAVAAASGAALALLLRGVADDATLGGVAGFLAMTLPLLAAGTWLASRQGRPGPQFLVALGSGIVLRAVLLAMVVALAVHRGGPTLAGALAGLTAGFLPLTVFEMIWFARRSHAAFEAAGKRA